MWAIFNKVFGLNKRHVPQVNVRYFQLNPETRTLAIYNNREERIRGFKLVVKNREGVEYETRIPSLPAQEGVFVKLETLKDSTGNSFTGDISMVKAYTYKGVERFKPSGKGFRRVVKS